MKKFYDPETDSLMIVIKEGEADYYKEIAPGVDMEFNKAGELIGIEVQNAYRPYDKQETSEPKINFKIFPVQIEASLPMQSVNTRLYTI